MLGDELRGQVRAYRRRGLTCREVAGRLAGRVSKSSVQRIAPGKYPRTYRCACGMDFAVGAVCPVCQGPAREEVGRPGRDAAGPGPQGSGPERSGPPAARTARRRAILSR